MRRHFIAMTLAGLLALGACSGNDDKTASTTGGGAGTATAADSAIGRATTCPELVQAAQPVFTTLFQGLVDDAQKLNAEELAAMAKGADNSALVRDFEAKLQRDGASIETKANALGCGQADARAAMCGAVAAIDGKGNVVAESMIAGMAGQCP